MNKEKILDFLKKHKLDIIIISSLLAVSLSVLLITTLTRKPGAKVAVEVDGKLVAEYPLDVDGRYILNGGTNELVVEGGVAYLTNSDCPDHTCERGKIRYIGSKKVCLPNLLTVTVVGEAEGDDYVDFTPGG